VSGAPLDPDYVPARVGSEDCRTPPDERWTWPILMPDQAPEGWLAIRRPTLARGIYASCPSRILQSLQCDTLTDCLMSNHVGRNCL
jgi:hypothetical protein